MAVDFEAEGLLDGLEDERERAARRDLLGRLHEDGATLDELRAAVEQARLVFLPMERALHDEPVRYTREEVSQRSGLDLDFLRRLWRSMGMADADPGQRAFTEEDVEAARRIAEVREGGMPDESLLGITRVVGQSMARISSAVGGAFGEAFIRPGDTELDLAERYAEATRRLRPVVLPLIDYVYGLHQRQQLRQAVMASGALAEGRLDGSREITVCFADLVGFTRLGERVPASELGAVAGRLADLAAEVATEPVRLVKMIGDAAMLVCFETDPLLDAVLALVEAADAQGEDFPQLRAGVAAGEAVGRGGDWYGRPVNLASRVCDQARPGSALVAEEVKDRANGGYRFSFAGKRRLKGLKAAITLFRLRRGGDEGS